MTTQLVPGTLVTAADAEDAAHLAAERMARTIREAQAARGTAFIALSGGNSPRLAYEELATAKDIDWRKVEVFWVDERAVAPTDERSNYHWAKQTLLDRTPIPEAHVHRMKAESSDLPASAAEYATLLQRLPQDEGMPIFDLLVMGIGDDGHTASLFPGMSMVDIRDRWVTAVPKSHKYEPRLTLTSPVIEAGRVVLALVVGAAKKEPLEKVFSVSGSRRETPARILRDVKGSLVWIIDRSAGGL